MLPTINVFGKEVAMYGLMILIGLAVGISVAVLSAKRFTVDKEDVFYSFLLGAMGLAAGSKILYFIVNAADIWERRDYYFSNLEHINELMVGGFVFYGGIIAAVAVLFWYFRKFRLDANGMLCAMVPSFPLAHAFGRVGCFCAGCCYGKPYDGPLAVTFERSVGAPNGVSLFPSQLVEAAGNLLIFVFLFFLARKLRDGRYTIAAYCIAYGTMRFFLEFMRGDTARGIYFGVSTSQWISIAAVVGATAFIIAGHLRKKAKQSAEES